MLAKEYFENHIHTQVDESFLLENTVKNSKNKMQYLNIPPTMGLEYFATILWSETYFGLISKSLVGCQIKRIKL